MSDSRSEAPVIAGELYTQDELKYLVAFSPDRAQGEYWAQRWSLEQYQQEMAEVTATFSTLSENVLELVGWFRSRDRHEVAEILGSIQQQEKEKLQLVRACVLWKVLVNSLIAPFVRL